MVSVARRVAFRGELIWGIAHHRRLRAAAMASSANTRKIRVPARRTKAPITRKWMLDRPRITHRKTQVSGSRLKIKITRPPPPPYRRPYHVVPPPLSASRAIPSSSFSYAAVLESSSSSCDSSPSAKLSYKLRQSRSPDLSLSQQR